MSHMPCAFCGKVGPAAQVEVAFIQPKISSWSEPWESGLAWICEECRSCRGNKTLGQWRGQTPYRRIAVEIPEGLLAAAKAILDPEDEEYDLDSVFHDILQMGIQFAEGHSRRPAAWISCLHWAREHSAPAPTPDSADPDE